MEERKIFNGRLVKRFITIEKKNTVLFLSFKINKPMISNKMVNIADKRIKKNNEVTTFLPLKQKRKRKD